jgi:hypothetical protein
MVGSRIEAVRTLEPGRWWCRAAGFGEVQPVHEVLSNGLVASCFIHMPLSMIFWRLLFASLMSFREGPGAVCAWRCERLAPCCLD